MCCILASSVMLYRRHVRHKRRRKRQRSIENDVLFYLDLLMTEDQQQQQTKTMGEITAAVRSRFTLDEVAAAAKVLSRAVKPAHRMHVKAALAKGDANDLVGATVRLMQLVHLEKQSTYKHVRYNAGSSDEEMHRNFVLAVQELIN